MSSAQGVSYALGGRLLLKEVSFDLSPGEVLAIVGPNGAGKSTLLKVLCGDLTPTQGQVTLEDRDLRDWSILAQAKQRALLPQESSLSFPFAVYEVALMGRNPHNRGAPSRHDQHIAAAALERTETFHFASREYPTLSGGEKQRVQLARILTQVWEIPETGSRYLFLDEPTNNLDLAHQHHTLRLAKRFAREGAGVLAVLHDLNLAAQYADRILLLCGGRNIALGTPEEVLNAEIICRTFNLPVVVTKHPCLGCPLVVSSGDLSEEVFRDESLGAVQSVQQEVRQ